jgi:dTDP-D-glucose 4,6-dehydratase
MEIKHLVKNLMKNIISYFAYILDLIMNKNSKIYTMDAAKLENELVWKAVENFDSGILKTIEWYFGKYKFC